MEEMTLRVPVAVKAKVTDDLKAKIVSDLETRLDMVNKDTVTVKIGDNLDALMGAEILLEDGKIVAFRQ
ncbi:MAG: YlqD family protein [Veillonella parvula]|nr:YlqD family protein [Veillonella parvula]